MEKKLDLRVQKTRSALTNALYQLLCEKSLDDITVTELCNRAVIRKATFYKHFGDKTELLVYMMQELQRISREENSVGYNPGNPYSFYAGVFQYLVDFVDSNEAFVTSILRSSSGAFVRNLLEEQIRRDINEQLRHEDREDVRDAHAMLSAMYAGAITSCGVWWIMQNPRPNKSEIIEQFTEFISKL